jgi:hypothetical protein
VMDLSRFGGSPLSLACGKVLTWSNLETPAKNIELFQARDFTNQFLAGNSPTTYQSSVVDAIPKFGQTYCSLFRKIVTYNQNSAVASDDMHRRWSSVDAYLEDA